MATEKKLEGLEWVEAEKQRGGRSVIPRVSIQKSGQIALNKQVVKEYVKDKRYAKLYYEPNKRLIGIKPISEADENAYKIRVNEKYGSASVSAMAFLNQRGLWPESAIAFEPTWLDSDQMIVIDLDNPVNSGGSNDEETSDVGEASQAEPSQHEEANYAREGRLA